MWHGRAPHQCFHICPPKVPAWHAAMFKSMWVHSSESQCHWEWCVFIQDGRYVVFVFLPLLQRHFMPLLQRHFSSIQLRTCCNTLLTMTISLVYTFIYIYICIDVMNMNLNKSETHVYIMSLYQCLSRTRHWGCKATWSPYLSRTGETFNTL